jgi:hypothetical protein
MSAKAAAKAAATAAALAAGKPVCPECGKVRLVATKHVCAALTLCQLLDVHGLRIPLHQTTWTTVAAPVCLSIMGACILC